MLTAVSESRTGPVSLPPGMPRRKSVKSAGQILPQGGFSQTLKKPPGLNPGSGFPLQTLLLWGLRPAWDECSGGGGACTGPGRVLTASLLSSCVVCGGPERQGLRTPAGLLPLVLSTCGQGVPWWAWRRGEACVQGQGRPVCLGGQGSPLQADARGKAHP